MKKVQSTTDGFTQTLIALLAFSLAANIAQIRLPQEEMQIEPTHQTITTSSTADDWDVFIQALVTVESGGDPLAVGTRDDVGILQITPVLVVDANRIVGREEFTLEGRKDPKESIRLFNVIQDHYNPSHDKQLALKVWNSRAPLAYHRKVMAAYDNLKQI